VVNVLRNYEAGEEDIRKNMMTLQAIYLQKMEIDLGAED